MSNKLPLITGREAVAAFSRDGFEVVRIRGSHHIMKKAGHEYLLTVPVHGNENLKPGTLRNLIRSAGLTVEEFVRLLWGYRHSTTKGRSPVPALFLMGLVLCVGGMMMVGWKGHRL